MTEHVYLSTGCFHGEHDYCKATEGHAGPKRPASCKFCGAPCVCELPRGGAMSADFSRVQARLAMELVRHADADGLKGVKRAAFFDRGGHAPGERCLVEEERQDRRAEMCTCGMAQAEREGRCPEHEDWCEVAE